MYTIQCIIGITPLSSPVQIFHYEVGVFVVVYNLKRKDTSHPSNLFWFSVWILVIYLLPNLLNLTPTYYRMVLSKIKQSGDDEWDMIRPLNCISQEHDTAKYRGSTGQYKLQNPNNADSQLFRDINHNYNQIFSSQPSCFRVYKTSLLCWIGSLPFNAYCQTRKEFTNFLTKDKISAFLPIISDWSSRVLNYAKLNRHSKDRPVYMFGYKLSTDNITHLFAMS